MFCYVSSSAVDGMDGCTVEMYLSVNTAHWTQCQHGWLSVPLQSLSLHQLSRIFAMCPYSPVSFLRHRSRPLSRHDSIKPSFNPGDLNSYRPISNLSFLSKLIERTVATQFIFLLMPITTTSCHRDSLHAYRRLHSTESALLVVFNDITRAVEDGKVVAMTLLNL